MKDRMNLFESIVNFLKGGNHAGGAEDCVPGGHGRDRRVLHKVSTVCEQALSDFSGIRMLASACADERGGDTGSVPSDPVRQESRALIAAAKKVGCFIETKDVPGTRYTIRTGESEVRLVQLIRFIDPIIGFKPPLLPRLKGALASEDGVQAIVNDLYRI